MKTLFIRIFALLGFFLASPAFADCPGFYTGICKENGTSLPIVLGSPSGVCGSYGSSSVIVERSRSETSTACTLNYGCSVSGGTNRNATCSYLKANYTPTPTPSPSPTPKPNPCADKTDISSSIGSFSTADYHPSKKFICKSGCAYSGSMAYVFTTGDPIGSSSCTPINGSEPVNGCTYYGFQSIAGLGKTCDDAYQDYVSGVTSGLTITFDPNGTPPTPAPTSAPTSSPTPPGSGTPAPTAPPSTPAPTPLPPGKCKGTVDLVNFLDSFDF